MEANLLALTQMMKQINEPSALERLTAITDAWNTGKLKVGKNITKNQAEKLSAAAFSEGLDFKVPSKAGRKFAFNAANTATFGLLPDKIFKPDPAIGERYHGERWGDTIAGGAGSLLGLAGGGYGLMKGGAALGNKAMGAWNNWRSMKNAKKTYNASMVGDDLALLGTRNTLGLPGPGVGRMNQIDTNTLLQLTAGNRAGGSMQRMLDNMMRNNYI